MQTEMTSIEELPTWRDNVNGRFKRKSEDEGSSVRIEFLVPPSESSSSAVR